MPPCHRDMGANRLIHDLCVRVFGYNMFVSGVSTSQTRLPIDHRITGRRCRGRSKPAVDVLTRYYCCRVLKIRYYYSDNRK